MMPGSTARQVPSVARAPRERSRPREESRRDAEALAWRKYGTPQHHADYTNRQHDTWRRLLARTEALVERHEARLHPAYVEGFRRLVLPWTTIPRLDDINAALASFGWRTLCVNGYLPPEVYSALLARGIFPISREIRPLEHLEFSPTPDLAHDMLGHIPMLVSAEHCAFMRRLSLATAVVRPNALDRELYQAHQTMGALRSASTSGLCSPRRQRALLAAEARVVAAQVALAAAPSPLAQLDRMYLWSIEFGLMGTREDFRIYGAGLLSSPAEVEALCTGPSRILDYSATVVRHGINFSEHQSAYFLARDYAHLDETLSAVLQPRRRDTGE
jgi:phenylalanine-4-hydroxylase